MDYDRRGRSVRSTPRVERAAREMRLAPTSAESLLWEAIRRRQVDGFRFRRQHPMGRFVIDFYCPERKLCIEVDGPVHDRQEERDRERTRVLEANGCTVVRFRNEEVLTDLLSVVTRLRAILRSGTEHEG